MLLEINIKNFIIIQQETINFSSGLNVITGETGAGKSLVIDALQIITGGKFTKEDIRHGSDKALISGLFSPSDNSELNALLKHYGISEEDDNILLISREVSTNGRSSCRINGQTVTLSMLKSVAQSLIDIVGQNEHQLLFNANKHIDFVDNFGDHKVDSIKAQIKSTTDSLKEIEAKYNDICGNASERERRLDLYRFQIDEIDSADLKSNEDEQLKTKRLLLINSEKLHKSLTQIYINLFKGNEETVSAVDILEASIHKLTELHMIDNRLQDFQIVIEAALYQLEDMKSSIRSYRDNIEFNDNEINNIEERLDLISKLKRKYGNTIEEIFEYRKNFQQAYDNLVNSEKIALELEKQIGILKNTYIADAKRLSTIREQLSRKLEKLVEKELQDLNMKGSKFFIDIKTDENVISPKGFDKLEFLLSPNPGEPPKQLNKIASGGEISRIMLAIKNTLTRTDRIHSIVFDEVDAGIGGLTASIVGNKIKNISSNSQVICVTHLAQIACFADNHIYIAKTVMNNKTYTRINSLNMQARVEEISRMLGGNAEDETSMAHAKQLIYGK